VDYNEQRPHSSLGYRTPTEFAAQAACFVRAEVGQEASNAGPLPHTPIPAQIEDGRNWNVVFSNVRNEGAGQLLKDMRMSLVYRDLKNLRRFQVVAFVIWILLSIVGTVWAVTWMARQRTMEELYRSARAGDSESIERLGRYNSRQASDWLVRLAQDRNTRAEIRVKAIRLLSGIPSFQVNSLTSLLWIEQPFVVRHAALAVFLNRRCDEDCVSAALYSVHGLYSEQPTLEMQLPSAPGSELTAQTHSSQLRMQSLNEYLALLAKDPCQTRNVLLAEYSSEPAFVSEVLGDIGKCALTE